MTRCGFIPRHPPHVALLAHHQLWAPTVQRVSRFDSGPGEFMRTDPDALDLFTQPVPALSRQRDPDTSRTAAAVVVPELGKIQRQVLDAFRELGPMSARQAERLPRFATYGFSTIRKRISELHEAGHLTSVGKEHTGPAPATTYRATKIG